MAMRTNTIHRHFPSSSTNHTHTFDAVYNETSGGTFTDETTDSTSTTAGDVTLLGASGDKMYFGSARRFSGFKIVTASTAGGTRTYEYWNGSAWTSITPTVVSGGLAWLAGTHVLKFTPPDDWATTAVNGATNYWLRAVVGTAYSTAGTASYVMGLMHHGFATITIDVPETTSRTILSAVLRLHWHCRGDRGGPDITRVLLRLGSATSAFGLDDENDLFSDAGDSGWTAETNVNVTSYFQSNFGSGASQ